MSIQLDPYIFFTGNCKEAMEFYKTVFGGELTVQAFDDMPGEKMPGTEGKTMHAHLKGGDVSLMASDGTRTEPYETCQISLSLSGSDEAKLN
jgi:PhnB protein